MIARAGGSSGGPVRKPSVIKKKKKKDPMEDDTSIDSDDPELVGANPEQRNWRGILIAVLVIVIVLSLIIVAIIVVSPKDNKIDPGDPFTFDNFMSEDFKPRQFSAEWISESSTYVYRNRESEMMQYNADQKSVQLIMDNSTFRELNSDLYFISPDLKYILLAYDVEYIYRHSFLAKYLLYNKDAKNPKQKLIPFPQGRTEEDWDGKKLQFAGWAKSGSALTFVSENNLYYQQDPFTTCTQVTSSGIVGEIYNGITDWLYEEEILHSTDAHWSSPGGDYLVYAQFDDSEVPKYRYPMYGASSDAYGYWDNVAYPKAGDRNDGINPVVRLYVVQTSNTRGAHKELLPPTDEIGEQDFYLNTVTWQDNDHVLVIWSNRPQNKSVVMLCDAMAGDCRQNMAESGHGRGWVSLFGRPGLKSFVTQGLWDVTEIVGFKKETSMIYFISTNGDARTRHLFKVPLPSHSYKMKTPECLTCYLAPQCDWVSASFSHDGEYYILNCEGPDVPSSTLKNTFDDTEIVVEDNAELRSKLENKARPIREYLYIKDDNGDEIMAEIFFPPMLNEEHITKYPMLINTYGGPGTQRVTKQFSVGFETYMSTKENTVYMLIDGHGSGGRGDTWLHSIYRRLGTKEVEDQILGARFARERFKFIDPERIAIWGWSYGGFVTAHALGHSGNDVISCGVAVAPVTDFRYYDTAYTEKFMGLAHSDDNYKGYDESNVAYKAVNFKDKHFMAVHGTGDDNVHFQHTAQLAKALTEAEVEFRTQIYADQNHALASPKTNLHLYRCILHFLKDECWMGGEPTLEGVPLSQLAYS
ncbi:hypothetical protein CAPTEDRAFT_228215 [Capitella teleta]|uniref:Uncharacterized protein n=1 Tax=Capitella teleta TaxID=283909 RepID=R7UD07_CAPTE|nr:hypothetical protein CAPTEDRAFT_228215 [Capitella teleta]|eukprot:ELU01683.1 hypothetical protein CAPTEDRAFT_228215 [Capitella teleta]